MTIAEEGTDISLLQKDTTIHTVKYADKNIRGVTVTKTHVIHHTSRLKGYPNSSICSIKGNLKYSRHIKEIDCLNCRRELTKYRPWKQETLLCGQRVEPDTKEDYPDDFPFQIMVRD